MAERVRILVLEDDDDLRDHLGMVLEDEGYDVTAVGAGAAAVEAAGEREFDLVVTDIRMKGLSGLDALEQVLERQPDVRSLVITGYSTEADSIRAIRLGVGAYLKKPFHLEEFLAAVHRLVAHRREEQEVRKRELALRRTAQLALEALARTAGIPSLVGSARLAARLAAEVGAPAEEVQIATLVSGLQRSRPETEAWLLVEALSPAIRSIVREADELWDGTGEEEVSTQATVVVLAQVAGELDSAEGPLSEQVAALQPDRFPPELLGALDRAVAAPAVRAPRAPEGARRRRALLSLARALDGEAAFSALRAVLEDDAASREGVEALLGMAHRCSAPDQVRDLALRAEEMAALVGPVAAAETALEAGLLIGGPEGAERLDHAARCLEELFVPGAAARAALAAAVLTGGDLPEASLARLLEPEHRDELVLASPWLLTPLLERGGGTPVEGRALRRLVREAPAELDRLLETLSAPARKAAVAALAQSTGPRSHALLQRLAADADEGVKRAAASALQGAPVEEGPPVLRIHSLGAFEVYRGDERIPEGDWQSRNVRHLLAYLARARRPVPVEQLLEQFWPDHPDTGRKNLNWATSILRKCLGEADYVLRTGQSLQLNPDLPRWHDLDELERELETFDPLRARRALQLYRGPYLEDCYLDWALDIRNQLELRVLDAARRLAAGGQPLETLEYARRVLEIDPCDQDAYMLLMQANLALDRPEEAVRQYEACCRMLRTELGLEPTIEMMREHQRALIALSVPR